MYTVTQRFLDSVAADLLLAVMLLILGKLIGIYAPDYAGIAIVLAFVLGAYWFR